MRACTSPLCAIRRSRTATGEFRQEDGQATQERIRVGPVVIGLERDAHEAPPAPPNKGNLDAMLVIQAHLE